MTMLVRRILFSLLSTPFLLAQGEVEPRSPAKKGSAALFVHETSMAAKLELQGREITTSERAARTLDVQVKDVDANGNLVVVVKFVRVQGRIEMAMGQGDASFDSAGENGVAESVLAKHLLDVVGKSFEAKVSPTGEVLELGEGAAAIVDASLQRAGMLQLPAESLKQMVGDLFGFLPAKRTAGGAKWNLERVEQQGRMPTRQKLELMLTVVEPEAFEIETTGTLDLAKDVLLGDKALAGGEAAEAKRQLESTKVTNGKVTGKQRTSRTDGFVVQSSRTLVFDMLTTQSQMGEVTTHMEAATKVARTTAEAAMPKAAAPAGGKAPADKK